jgi:hypothetical protein
MGMAIKHELGEGGRGLWDEWSATSDKFDQRDQERTWSSFKRNGVSAGTIFHEAGQAGWRDPQQEHYERVCEELGSKADQSSNEKPEHPDADGEFTADELSRMEFEPIKYVVPGFIAEGLTLFAGKPKIGKSWLLMHAAWSVARGDYTLGGLFCEQGDVFYAALEDNKRRLKSRMDKLFPDVPWPRRLTFKCSMPRLAEGGLDAIKEWIKKCARPRLIIIDTLAMVRMPNRKDQTNYDADYAAVKELRDLAGKSGVAIIILHHLRKAEADDPFDMISGTLGLTGCPDTIMIIYRESGGVDHRRRRPSAAIRRAYCRRQSAGGSRRRNAYPATNSVRDPDEGRQRQDAAPKYGQGRHRGEAGLREIPPAGRARVIISDYSAYSSDYSCRKPLLEKRSSSHGRVIPQKNIRLLCLLLRA